MLFNKLINSILKEEEIPSRADRIQALDNLENIVIGEFIFKGTFEQNFVTCCKFEYKGLPFALLDCGDKNAAKIKDKDTDMLNNLAESLDMMIEKGAMWKASGDYTLHTDWGALAWWRL
jgi:hypothetical protein